MSNQPNKEEILRQALSEEELSAIAGGVSEDAVADVSINETKSCGFVLEASADTADKLVP